MKKLKTKLQGRKTYITAAITIILLIVGHFLEWDQATIEKIIGGGVMAVGVFIRSGIASSLGMAQEASKVAEVLGGVTPESINEAKDKADALKAGVEVFNSAPSLADIEKVMELTGKLGVEDEELDFIKENAASWLMKIAADPDEKSR